MVRCVHDVGMYTNILIKCIVLSMWKINISGNPLIPEVLDIAAFTEYCLWRRYKCYRLKAHLHLWCAYNYI